MKGIIQTIDDKARVKQHDVEGDALDILQALIDTVREGRKNGIDTVSYLSCNSDEEFAISIVTDKEPGTAHLFIEQGLNGILEKIS